MLKLNIYNKSKVEKTYTAETAHIMYGTIEDIISIVDFDKLADLENADTKMYLAKLIIKAIPTLKPMLAEIFDGLTEEEMRRVRVDELIPLFVEIFKYAFSQFSTFGAAKGKN